MANRRMFSLDIVDTDKFLDMPISSQCLYYHLGMRADDDGFVANPKKITKSVNCATDDLNVLISRGFLIAFDDGIVVVAHWRQNNYLRNDRYKPTIYQRQLALLTVDQNGVYQMDTSGIPSGIPNGYQMDTSGIPTVSKLDTQDSIGKDRLGKDNINNNARTRAREETSQEPVPIIPKKQDVIDFCRERKSSVDPERFFSYYSERGWMIKGQPITDFRPIVERWEKNDRRPREKPPDRPRGGERTVRGNFEQREYPDEFFDSLVNQNKGGATNETAG